METTRRSQVQRSERTIVCTAAIAACVVAFASLAFAEPSTEYALDGASFDVAPARLDVVKSDPNPALATLALHTGAWHADESASGTRPDAAH